MADDTRQKEDLSKEALNVNPENKPFTGQQWKDVKPPENANLMAGGTEHTAGGKTPEVTVGNAFEGGLKWKDFTELHKRPCVRDSALQGMGSGAVLGALRAVTRGGIASSCNYAVAGTLIVSGVMFQYCHYTRRAEKDGMMRAMQIMKQKDMEKVAKQQQKDKAKEERRRLKDEEQDAKLAAAQSKGDTGKPWWKVW